MTSSGSAATALQCMGCDPQLALRHNGLTSMYILLWVSCLHSSRCEASCCICTSNPLDVHLFQHCRQTITLLSSSCMHESFAHCCCIHTPRLQPSARAVHKITKRARWCVSIQMLFSQMGQVWGREPPGGQVSLCCAHLCVSCGGVAQATW